MDAANRRKFVRFRPPECEISITKETTGLAKLLGRSDDTNIASGLYDISEGGVRVSLKERLAVGLKVRVRLKVLKFNDDVNQEGTVSWLTMHAYRTDLFIAGITFTKVDAATQRVIGAMRGYFLSPQYKLKTETRIRTSPNTPLPPTTTKTPPPK